MEDTVIDFARADGGSWHSGLVLEFAKQRKGEKHSQPSSVHAKAQRQIRT